MGSPGANRVQPAPGLGAAPSRAAAWRRLTPDLLALGGYLLLALWWLRPIWRWFATGVAPDPGDPWFNLFVLDWGWESLQRGFAGVWSPPIFHPTPGTLAYSDHLLGPVVLTAPLRALGLPVVAAYNTLLLASFVLGGFFTYVLCRRHGVSRLAAFAGGIVYVAAPFRWEQMSHLAILGAQWLPLLLLAWDELLRRPEGRRALAFLVAYALHVTGGTSLAYLAHLPLVVLLLVHLRQRQGPLRTRRAWRVLLPAGLFAAALAALVFLPYWRIGREQGLGRSASEIREHGATLASFLVPSHRNLYYDRELWRGLRRDEAALFPGFVASGLLLCAACAFYRRRGGRGPLPALGWRRRGALLVAGSVGVLGLLLADLHTRHGARVVELPAGSLVVEDYALPLGLIAGGALTTLVLYRRYRRAPALRRCHRPPWDRAMMLTALFSLLLCFPAFYLPAAAVIPGLDGMRVTTRLFAIALLPLAYLIARSFDRLRRATGRLGSATAAATLLVLAAESTPQPLSWVAVPTTSEHPAVYRWLSRQPAVDGVLELPFARREPDEIPRLLGQRVHRKPIANGYSGYLAPSFVRLRRDFPFPPQSPAELDVLRDQRISHLVLGRRRGPRHARGPVELPAALTGGPRPEARLVYRDQRHVVYEVLPRRPMATPGS